MEEEEEEEISGREEEGREEEDGREGRYPSLVHLVAFFGFSFRPKSGREAEGKEEEPSWVTGAMVESS